MEEKKEKVVSPASLFLDSLVHADEIETAIVVSLGKDGDINIGFSDYSRLGMLGLLDVAKQSIFDEFGDEGEGKEEDE